MKGIRKPEPAVVETARSRRITPHAALPGGEVQVEGVNLRSGRLPEVRFGGLPGSIVMAGSEFLLARVPEGALSGAVQVLESGESAAGNSLYLDVALPIADNLHPVSNPALDREGNIYVTFSGGRGQKVPVSLYQLDAGYNLKPLGAAIVSPTGLAFDHAGQLYASSRHDGMVYRVERNGTASMHAEGLGIATGIAFDADGNLYVGDRSGTIFKLDSNRNIFVFATLEPSVSAYHLAFSGNGDLYVSGPTTSSFDPIYRITPKGAVDVFFRGLGRPQGLAFDAAGNLYIAASLRGRRGLVRISPAAKAELVLSGQNLVGVAFARGPALILATHSGLYFLPWSEPGMPLPPAPPA